MADEECPIMDDGVDVLEETVVSSEDDPPNQTDNSMGGGDGEQQEDSNDRNGDGDKSRNDQSFFDPNDPFAAAKEELTMSHSEFWEKYTGLKMKEFSEEEMKAFEKPFHMGWRREVVLRGTEARNGKKIGDVYYFGPDKKVKLRSCVEMGLFLKKNPNCGLEPENFTFARQPIYKAPEEIVRHAMGRGSNQVSVPDQSHIIPMPTVKPSPTKSTIEITLASKPAPTVTIHEETSQSGEGASLIEGRSKRKRVAPTRFEDEDYLETSPFKREKRERKDPYKQTPSPLVTKTTTGFSGKPGITIRLNRPKPSSSDLNKQPSYQNQQQTPRHHQYQQPKMQESPKNPLGPGPSVASSVAETSNQEPSENQSSDERISNPNNDVTSNVPPVALPPPPRVTLPNIVKKKPVNTQGQTLSTISNIEIEGKVTNGTTKLQPATAPSSVLKPIKPKPPQTESTSSIVTNPKIKPLKPKPPVVAQANVQPFVKHELVESPASFSAIGDESDFDEGKDMVPPCSIMCGGGQLPDLLCTRCLCLFHKGCVPKGIFLIASNQFVCPNCIQPSDQGKLVGEPAQSSGMPVEPKEPVSMVNGKEGVVQPRPEIPSQPPSLIKIPSGKPSPLLQHLMKQTTTKPPQARDAKGRFIPILPKPNAPSATSTPIQCQNATNRPSIITDRHKSQLRLLKDFQEQKAMWLNTESTHHFQSQHIRPKIGADLDGQVKPLPSKGKPLTRVPMFGKLKVPPKHSLPSQQHQQSNSSSFKTSPTGLMSKGQHMQMSQMIQKQLQTLSRTSTTIPSTMKPKSQIASSSYRPLPIAPIAPISITPSQVASIIDRKSRNKYRDWLAKNKPPITRFFGPFEALNEVFRYLSTKDLSTLKFVSRTCNMLASQQTLWQSLSLKNIHVKNWNHLGRAIIERNGAIEVDFEGIKIPHGSDLFDVWRNFQGIVSFMKSVKTLKFGTIPSFVVVMITSHPNIFTQLTSLSIKNISDDVLTLVQNLHSLSSLKSLKIASRNGFKITPDITPATLINSIGNMRQLTSLSILNLRQFPATYFEFLDSLTDLKSLELGNCDSWSSSGVEDGQNSHQDEEIPPPFRYITPMSKLESLKLIQITLDESTMYFATLLNNLSSLKSLTLESLTVTPDAIESVESLSDSVVNSRNLKSITITSNEAFTNRMVFDFVKRLHTLKHLVWKVGVTVEDSGECFVPLTKDDNDDDDDMDASEETIEPVEIVVLTEQLEGLLPRTKVTIEPQ